MPIQMTAHTAQTTAERQRPLDHPSQRSAHRVYATLTNHCNRACPWCSTCSSPAGMTFLDPEVLAARLPRRGPFELQLEGGEPTVHPRFWDFVELARGDHRCRRLIVVTNGVAVPHDDSGVTDWIMRLGQPLTIKLSINHYLLDHDRGLIELAMRMRDAVERLSGDRSLVLNVRLRRGVDDDDRAVIDSVREAGLESCANIFYLQRYGFAADETGWDRPHLEGSDFSMINPDGARFGPDLIARSEAMRVLP